MKYHGYDNARHQKGAATLLIALVLMMAITVLTLSVARTGINQAHIDSNQQWHDRLLIAAESAIERLLPRLVEIPEAEWRSLDDNAGEIWQQSSNDSRIETDLRITRSRLPRRILTVQAATRRVDDPGPGVQVTRQFRRLSILSPLAEPAPPLIIRGCLTGTSANDEIYPLNADSDGAGDAIWLTDGLCPAPDIDIHQGSVRTRTLPADLWDTLFTLTREDYALRAEQEQDLPTSQRHYRVATSADLDRQGRWPHSLGSADQHQMLYFPPGIGCPGFAAGVRIYGVVFVDAPCTSPLTLAPVDIYGTLAVNGSVNTGTGGIRLANIQREDIQQTALRFPTLRHVRIPGTWKDF